MAGLHQLVYRLGKFEIIDAPVAHGQIGERGKVNGGHHPGHQVENEKFDIQLVMDKAIAGHRVCSFPPNRWDTLR